MARLVRLAGAYVVEWKSFVVGTEWVLCNGMEWHRQTQADGEMNGTKSGSVTTPI